MKLNHKILGEGQPLVILHGLFGMLDNWQTLGKRWTENYRVILVDLRNHGHSPHAPELNYQVMMDDLEELADDLFLDEINILGHSMGGKLGIKFAQTYPELMDKLIVADIGPKKYPIHHHHILEGLKSVPLHKMKSRQDVKEQLSKYINQEHIIQFFLKNLYWKERGVLAWRFNLDAISNNIQNVGDNLLNERFGKPTLFVRGGSSDYILDEDIPAIKASFPNAEIATIPNAGHWLHAENPDMFFELVDSFLRK